MPFPLHDVHRQFRLKNQPYAQGFLSPGDAEGLPGIGSSVEVLLAEEVFSGGLDLPEPGQREGCHAVFLLVVRQQIPVSVIGEQVVGS